MKKKKHEQINPNLAGKNKKKSGASRASSRRFLRESVRINGGVKKSREVALIELWDRKVS